MNMLLEAVEFLLKHVERHGDGNASPKAGELLAKLQAEVSEFQGRTAVLVGPEPATPIK